MLKTLQKKKRMLHARRRRRIRAKLAGSPERPRLAFHRSLRHLYAQVVDDAAERTLLQRSTDSKARRAEGRRSFRNVESAKALGAEVGRAAKERGIEAVVFDRGGHRYHGIVKAFADAVREQGIKF